MKRSIPVALCSLITASFAARVLAQGTVVFESAASTGWITVGPNTGPASYAAAGTYTVALLWAPGTTPVPQSAFTQIALYGLATGGITQTGFFSDSTVVLTGNATIGGTPALFEVQGWLGNYTSYAAASAAGVPVGQTAEFVNRTGDPRPPATPPILTTGWDGNMILGVPEPGTLAICAFGAVALLFLRRRN